MMQYFPYKVDANIFYGHAILGELPKTFGVNPTALLIRESIQNSLDAAIGSLPDDQVRVRFGIHKLPGDELDAILPNTDFGEGKISFLEISDFDTIGLDGDLERPDTPEEMGRFWRFALSMAVNQTRIGAGGSWGMGKSIYHLFGTGLILIHTRLEDGSERFCAKCVIDERKEKPDFLKEMPGTGVVFWGARLNEPITDKGQIQNIVNQLKLPERQERGTSLYLMLSQLDRYLDLDALTGAWEEALLARITSEWQKWYFPRLHRNARPILKVESLGLDPDFMQQPPVLEKYLLLHNIAQEILTDLAQKENTLLFYEKKAKVSGKIPAPIAALCWSDFTKTELTGQGWGNDLLQDYPSGEEENDVLIPRLRIALVREAGMVIRYVDTLLPPPESLDMVRLGVLLINGGISLPKPGNQNEMITAEEYFRGCEGKDHSGWDDKNWERPRREETNYWKKLQREIQKQFQESGKSSDTVSSKDKEMGRLAGASLLGRYGFGHGGHVPEPDNKTSRDVGRSGGGGRAKPTGIISMKRSGFDKDRSILIDVAITLELGQKILLIAKARSGREKLKPGDWLREMDAPAPWHLALHDVPPCLAITKDPEGILLEALTDINVQNLRLVLATNDPDLSFLVEGVMQ